MHTQINCSHNNVISHLQHDEDAHMFTQRVMKDLSGMLLTHVTMFNRKEPNPMRSWPLHCWGVYFINVCTAQFEIFPLTAVYIFVRCYAKRKNFLYTFKIFSSFINQIQHVQSSSSASLFPWWIMLFLLVKSLVVRQYINLF